MEKDSRLPIPNVKFSVKYKDGQDIGTYVTDSNGMINIEGLNQGLISIEEVNGNENYKINSKKYDLELEYNESQKIVIENEKKK